MKLKIILLKKKNKQDNKMKQIREKEEVPLCFITLKKINHKIKNKNWKISERLLKHRISKKFKIIIIQILIKKIYKRMKQSLLLIILLNNYNNKMIIFNQIYKIKINLIIKAMIFKFLKMLIIKKI